MFLRLCPNKSQRLIGAAVQPGSGVDRAGPKGRRRRTSCRRDVYPGAARCRRSASDSLCRARRGGVQSVLHPNGRLGRSGARRGSDLAGRSGQEFARRREDGEQEGRRRMADLGSGRRGAMRRRGRTQVQRDDGSGFVSTGQ